MRALKLFAEIEVLPKSEHFNLMNPIKAADALKIAAKIEFLPKPGLPKIKVIRIFFSLILHKLVIHFKNF